MGAIIVKSTAQMIALKDQDKDTTAALDAESYRHATANTGDRAATVLLALSFILTTSCPSISLFTFGNDFVTINPVVFVLTMPYHVYLLASHSTSTSPRTALVRTQYNCTLLLLWIVSFCLNLVSSIRTGGSLPVIIVTVLTGFQCVVVGHIAMLYYKKERDGAIQLPVDDE